MRERGEQGAQDRADLLELGISNSCLHCNSLPKSIEQAKPDLGIVDFGIPKIGMPGIDKRDMMVPNGPSTLRAGNGPSEVQCTIYVENSGAGGAEVGSVRTGEVQARTCGHRARRATAVRSQRLGPQGQGMHDFGHGSSL
ncbi:hypothetical protein GCM10010833_32210 [Blastomonas aquatica]|uniref:Uncharacterized protein n=1 Tax=Blastomonas aquatica TaxID=1510276 RepID=A0ABQ1JTG6_9SPHN|nr:hypothetical protein GCM10010833_32210 [Blastomonas aquatica]